MLQPVKQKTTRVERIVPVGNGYPDDVAMRQSISSEIQKILTEPENKIDAEAASRFEEALSAAAAYVQPRGYVIVTDDQMKASSPRFHVKK